MPSAAAPAQGIEEGELPEDGEIMEDEDEVTAPAVPASSTPQRSSLSRNRESSKSSSKKRKQFVLEFIDQPRSHSSNYLKNVSALPLMSLPRSSTKASSSSSSKYKDYDSKPTVDFGKQHMQHITFFLSTILSQL
jgi:hypothetical protein